MAAVAVSGRIPFERVAIGLLVLGTAGAAYGLVRWPGATAVDVRPAAAAFVGIFAIIAGLVLTLARPLFDGVTPALAAQDAQIDKGQLILEPPWQLGLPLLSGLGLIIVIIAAIVMFDDKVRGAAQALGIAVAAASAITLAWVAGWRRSWLALAHVVLGASSPIVCTITGEPFARHTAYRRRRESRTVTETAQDGTTRTRDRMVSWVEGHPRTATARTATATLADGSQLTIETHDAIWFAPLRFEPTTDVARTAARIGDGNGAIVVGKPRDGTIRSTGPESLIVFGAPGDARAVLRRMVLGWYAMAVLVGVLAATCVGLAIAL
jgi:hypothetical protein